MKAVRNLQQEALRIAIDINYGVPRPLFGAVHDIIRPYASNYHLWQRKIKKAFDPNSVSDASDYIAATE